jgi:hypothetical protein
MVKNDAMLYIYALLFPNSSKHGIRNMKEGSSISVRHAGRKWELPTQILEDLEAKSKPLNNRLLLIIHPEFQTFQCL